MEALREIQGGGYDWWCKNIGGDESGHQHGCGRGGSRAFIGYPSESRCKLRKCLIGQGLAGIAHSHEQLGKAHTMQAASSHFNEGRRKQTPGRVQTNVLAYPSLPNGKCTWPSASSANCKSCISFAEAVGSWPESPEKLRMCVHITFGSCII